MITRGEAMERALAILESTGPGSQAGLGSKAIAYLKLAEMLPDEARLTPAVTTLFGWHLDNRVPPTEQQYRSAMAVVQGWSEKPHFYHPVHEVEAVRALIAAYRRHQDAQERDQ